MTIIAGIDPGREGCCCLISEPAIPGGAPEIEFWDTPTLKTGDKTVYNLGELVRMFRESMRIGTDGHAFLEKVQPQPMINGKGGFGAGPNFHLGYSLGMWEAMLASFEVPYTLVSPQRWKKDMLSDMGKEKGASRVRALQLFPSLQDKLKRVKDHNRADALLIAAWGRKSYSTEQRR